MQTKNIFEIQRHGNNFLVFEYNFLHTLGLQNKCLHVILLPKMSKKHKYENDYSQRSDLL